MVIAINATVNTWSFCEVKYFIRCWTQKILLKLWNYFITHCGFFWVGTLKVLPHDNAKKCQLLTGSSSKFRQNYFSIVFKSSQFFNVEWYVHNVSDIFLKSFHTRLTEHSIFDQGIENKIQRRALGSEKYVWVKIRVAVALCSVSCVSASK